MNCERCKSKEATHKTTLNSGIVNYIYEKQNLCDDCTAVVKRAHKEAEIEKLPN